MIQKSQIQSPEYSICSIPQMKSRLYYVSFKRRNIFCAKVIIVPKSQIQIHK